MTELERRALLGDRQAQEECTEKGIALPCPKCGKSVQRFETVASLCCLDSCSEAYYDLRNYFGVVCNTLKGGCGIFVCGEKEASEKSALAEWNTRPAPPIGRCKDCANWYKRHCASGQCATEPTDADFFCGNFEPKPQLKELATLQPLEGVGAKGEAGETCVPGTRQNGCHNCENHEQTAKEGVLVCTLIGARTSGDFCCTGWEPKGGKENG